MATNKTGAVTIADTNYQRGAVFEEINHDRVANAVRYISYAKLYYPDEYQVFVKSVAIRRATWSIEDANFIAALYDFEAHFLEFLNNHPGVEQELSRMSPKEMVDRVDMELIEEARTWRDAARRVAERAVANAMNRKLLALNAVEKEILVQTVEKSVRVAASEAESVNAFRRLVEERAPAVTTTSIVEIITGDPAAVKQLLFSDATSSGEVLDRTLFSALPNKRALHTIVTSLPIKPEETRQEFLNRAESVARITMAASADLSQTPIARAEPSRLVSAILEATGNKTALGAFERLTEQAKNAVSLTVVAKAWEDTVDVITKRAGGALANSLDPIIQKANQQSVSGPAKHAASLVGDVLGPLLGPAFTSAVELEALNRSLPPGQKLFSDKSGVATFIQSLDATRRAEGAASAALFLTVTMHYPGVQFVEQRSDNPLAPVVTVVQFAKESIAWKVFDRAAKSEVVGGFFGKILRPVLGFFGIKVGGAVAGKGFSALIGSLLGGTVAPVVGHVVGFVSGFLVMPLLQKVGGWLKNLATGRFGQLKMVQDAILGLSGARAPSAPKLWYEQDWVPIVIIIAVAVLIPMFGAMLQITTQNSALVVSGVESQPDVFTEHELYPPPDYIDFAGLESKEFSCLTYGEGVSTSYGRSERFSSDQKSKIEGAIAAYPQIKLLSCSINCSSPINITAFHKDAAYAGYAPSSLSGNIVFYPRAFRFTTQNLAKLLAHELSHNIDWRNADLARGFYALGCEKTGTYPRGWGETPEETFAEAVGLYMIGWPNMRSYCGGKALSYFNSAFNQCR